MLDSHVAPLVICADPDCRGWALSDARHFDLHNQPCAAAFVTAGGDEGLCGLAAGHSGPHRGAAG